MEAKYVAICEVVKEVVWLKKFLSDLSVMVAQSKDPSNHKKGKHIERKYHIIQDIVTQGDVVVAKIDSANNLVDHFTKTPKDF